MARKEIKYRTHHEALMERLQDPEYASLYLQASYEEKDPDLFSMALRDVWEARGGSLSEISEDIALDKQQFRRIFSQSGPARAESLKTVFHEIGLDLDSPMKR